jgi:hypothetical protein
MSSFYVPLESIKSLSQTFAERIGPPDEASSALGHVFVGFSWLERSLEKHIRGLAILSPSFAFPPMAELSFNRKVAVLTDLVRLQPAVRKFNTGDEDLNEVWNDFVQMLLMCENLFSDLVRSYLLPSLDGSALYAVTSGRVAGLWSHDLAAHELIDIYDYMLHVGALLDEFFLDLDGKETPA